MLAALCLGVLLVGIELFITAVALPDIFFDISNANFTINAGGPLTRYVSTTGSDAGNDCTNPANPCATIGHAINRANDEDTIDVAVGTYVEPGLVVAKDVDIVGAGVLVR